MLHQATSVDAHALRPGSTFPTLHGGSAGSLICPPNVAWRRPPTPPNPRAQKSGRQIGFRFRTRRLSSPPPGGAQMQPGPVSIAPLLGRKPAKHGSWSPCCRVSVRPRRFCCSPSLANGNCGTAELRNLSNGAGLRSIATAESTADTAESSPSFRPLMFAGVRAFARGE